MMTDFYTQLQLPIQKLSKEVIDQAFVCQKENTSLRDAWVTLRDPFFQDYYLRYQKEGLIEAGWFDHQCSVEEIQRIENDYQILSTPLDKLQTDLKVPLVLLTSGSFSPLHQGHIEMMNQTKDYFVSKGFEVAGGYLSPSHDGYVDSKYEEKLSGTHRTILCQQMTKDSDWLMVDAWEALYTPRAINYTDVYLRLQKYLHKYFHPETLLCYVCGEDNANFAKVFFEQGMCAIVKRQIEQAKIPELLKSIPEKNTSVHIINNNDFATLSSSSLRKVNHLKTQEFESQFDMTSPHTTYAIRMDIKQAGRNWLEEKLVSPNALEIFSQDCAHLIKYALTTPQKWPEKWPQLSIEFLYPEKQLEVIENKYVKERIVNIDRTTNSQHLKVDVSRIFNIADAQFDSQEIIIASHDTLEEKEYVLIDDDIISGKTVAVVKEHLQQQFQAHIIQIDSMLQNKVYDVVDIKDFLVGVSSGGLKVKLNNHIFRVPYLAPFVNLYTRAKIPSQNIMQLNKELWHLNYNFFLQHPSITINHCDAEFILFVQYQGFNTDMAMHSYIKKHLDLFY